MRTTAKTRARNTRTACDTNRATQYATLNGRLQAALDRGQIIRTGDMLDRLGIQLPDGQQSWYGRHVAKAHRTTTGLWSYKATRPAAERLYAEAA
jgi:hypothetical protein